VAAPCDYAASANPDGAKLLFAFVIYRLKYQSIPIIAPTKFTLQSKLLIFTLQSKFGGGAGFRPQVLYILNHLWVYLPFLRFPEQLV